MSNFKTSFVFLFFLFIFSCDESSNNISSDGNTGMSDKISSNMDVGPKNAMKDWTKFGIANNPNNVLGGLKIGDEAPEFMMSSQSGEKVSLQESLEDGPVLLVFLRAEWCSFCVKHLKEFQDKIQEINNKSQAKVLAISPQKSSYMQDFHKENELSFPILFDEDHSVMKDYKVFFHVTKKYNDYIEKAKGNRIEVFNGDKDPVMPVPATYLVGRDGKIKFVHYDPNYKKRSDLKEILAQL
jgi:peroxiredoxin